MYSIANIIYGYDLTVDGLLEGREEASLLRSIFYDGDKKVDFNDEKLKEIIESGELIEHPFFHSYYSGSSDYTPMALGLDVGGFDECSSTYLSDLVTKVEPHHVEEFQKMLGKLPIEVQNIINKLGEPKLFILWSTS